MNIGIGITTRNRPKALKICLDHFKKFESKDYNITYVVSDDSSSLTYNLDNFKSIEEAELPVKYIVNTERQGISNNKNNCLKLLGNQDFYFLFDDDCFPSNYGWENMFLNASVANNVNHLMFLEEEGIINEIERRNGITTFTNCLGCCLFFTKKAIKTVGGFDTRMHMYGYEHAQLTRRIDMAGLMNGFFGYSTPTGIEKYIYSFDVRLKRGIEPPLGKGDYEHTSSMTADAEEDKKASIEHNASLFSNVDKIYCEI